MKSIKQRQLTRYSAPRRLSVSDVVAQVDATEIVSSLDNLCVMDVNREGPTLRYRIREHGDKLSEYYGSTISRRFHDAGGARCTYCHLRIGGQRPAAGVHGVAGHHTKGRAVTLERLPMPFTVSGSAVDVVLTSLKAISIDGALEHFKVLEPSQRKAFSGFQGIIKAPAQP